MMLMGELLRNLHPLMRTGIYPLNLTCRLKMMCRTRRRRRHSSGANVQLQPKQILMALKTRKSLHFGCYVTADRVKVLYVYN